MVSLRRQGFVLFLIATLLSVGFGSHCEPCCGQDATTDEKSIRVDLGEGQVMELIRIPKGQFQMGSPETEESRKPDELRHPVVLSQDFYLSKYPVTVGQFKRFVSETRYRTEAEAGESGGYGVENGQLVQKSEYNWQNPGYPITDDHPVTIVTVIDANMFLNWLRSKAERECRLPTEAQWEYACRAGTTTRYYNGDAEAGMDEIGWHQKNASGMAHPVGQKQPNPWGLHDMSGNVYEWCLDIYNTYPGVAQQDPEGKKQPAGEPPRNVLRGGSWMRLPERCRSAARYRATPGTRNAENGFRVVMSSQKIEIAKPQPFGVTNDPSQNPAPESASRSLPSDAGHGVPISTHARPSILSFLLWPGLCCGGFVIAGLVAAIIWSQLGQRHGSSLAETASTIAGTQALRDTLRSREEAPAANPDPVRLVDDGFWITGFPVGTSLLCSYWVMNEMHQITAEIESPDGQFVYTGDRPQSVEIVSIDDPEEELSGTAWEEPEWTSDSRETSTSTPTTTPSESPPPIPNSSFPPAY